MKNVLKLLNDNLKIYEDCLANVEKIRAKGYMTSENYAMYLKSYKPIIMEYENAIELITKHLKS